MDTPATSSGFVKNESKTQFIRVPVELYQVVLTCRLPDDAKMLLFLIHRLTTGCQRRAVIIDGADIYNILGIERHKLRMMIAGLANLKVLLGCGVKKDALGKNITYELSINYDITAWDVSVLSTRTTILNNLLKQILYTSKP